MCVYLYLCICICVFVYLYLYLCLCGHFRPNFADFGGIFPQIYEWVGVGFVLKFILVTTFVTNVNIKLLRRVLLISYDISYEMSYEFHTDLGSPHIYEWV